MFVLAEARSADDTDGVYGAGVGRSGTALLISGPRLLGSSWDCTMRRPELIQRTLCLDDPDDATDERNQHPESRWTLHGLHVPFSGVEVARLRRHHEDVHYPYEDGKEQSDSAPDPFTGIPLQLLEGGVLPVEGIDP